MLVVSGTGPDLSYEDFPGTGPVFREGKPQVTAPGSGAGPPVPVRPGRNPARHNRVKLLPLFGFVRLW